MVTYPIIHLRWFDAAHQNPDTWVKITDVDKTMTIIETIGFLIDEDDVRYVVAHTVDPSNENACGIFHIPKALAEVIG